MCSLKNRHSRSAMYTCAICGFVGATRLRARTGLPKEAAWLRACYTADIRFCYGCRDLPIQGRATHVVEGFEHCGGVFSAKTGSYYYFELYRVDNPKLAESSTGAEMAFRLAVAGSDVEVVQCKKKYLLTKRPARR